MSSSDFFVHTPGLDQNAGEYVQVAKTVSRLGSQVNSDTSGYDGVWGNDSAGKKFEPGYLTNKASFIEGVTALANVLQATSDGLILMSKNFVKTEDRNTEVARKLAVDFKPSESGGGGGSGGESGGQLRGVRRLKRASTSSELTGESQPMQAGRLVARKSAMPGELTGESQPMQAGRLVARESVMPGTTAPMQAGRLVAQKSAMPGTTAPAQASLRMAMESNPAGALAPTTLMKATDGPVGQEQIGAWASNQREWNSALLNTDKALRAEYASRGLEYPEPFGPPVAATPAHAAVRYSAGDTLPPVPTPAELDHTAQALGEADVRLQRVQERMLAAGEAIGWKFAQAAAPAQFFARSTLPAVPLRADG
ncbi:MAG: hypothetical protein QOI21_3105 [Actinomycetota bacterium]|jgi:uncharacterized protein YukE|nr:hypothetical protein [Actinomycetota bacterium]